MTEINLSANFNLIMFFSYFQTVCDADKRFLFIDPRFGGASHDAYVLRKGELLQFCENGGIEGFKILGDSA